MKKIFILVISILSFVSSAYAECWVNTTPDDANPVYIDIDSICKKQNGTFFNIKYAVNGSSSESVFTIHSKDNKAFIVKSCTYSEYMKNKYSMSPKNAPSAKEFNNITSDCKIYNAYKVSKLSTYNLNKLRNNPNELRSLLFTSSVGSCGTGHYTSNPGGGSGRPGIDAIKEPDFGPYMRDLQRRIKLNWTPPKGNESKQVVLLFKIAKNGQLLSCRVFKSSGFPAADQAALNAVKLSAPFRPLPVDYKGNNIEIQFTFDYRVFGGSSR